MRHPESDEKVVDPDNEDPELAVLISRLNESSAENDDTEDADVDGFQEVWGSGAEGLVGPDLQEAPGDCPEISNAVVAMHEGEAAAPKRQDLPEELEELGHSFQSALFPGLNRSGQKRDAPEETNPSRTGTDEGGASRLSMLGIASIAVLTVLGAVWFGSQMNMKIVNLNKTVAHLEQQVLEGRASIQKTEQALGNIMRLHEENGESIQRIERAIAGLKLSTEADIGRLGEQIEGLRNASAETDIPMPLVPVLEPSQVWGINLASFANRDAALGEAEKIRGTGIEVVMREILIADKRWYRLRVEGFPDKDAARSFIQLHHDQPGFSGAWVSREP